MNRLTDDELEAAKHNLAEAKASLACEGMHLTADEEALFTSFDEDRISHDESIQRALEFSRRRRASRVRAAE